MTDQNRKTLRHFQCRDYLWEIFTQMSHELECSVDYLVNEAMRQYARSRNYGTRPGTVSTVTGPQQASRGSGGIPPLGSSAGQARAPAPPPLQPPAAPPPRGPFGGPPRTPPPPPPPPGHVGTAPFGMPPSRPVTPPPRESYPPPLPGARTQSAPRSAGLLYVVFNGQKTPVNKAEFIIGRGSKTADLAIRDGNISRRHCAVVLQGNEYWMKDLGSTNGVEFAGQRIDTKRIEEGDTFTICDYEIRFTYR